MQNNVIITQLNFQAELKEVEDRFRKAMIANAQLDNDKASQTYQLELLKDRFVYSIDLPIVIYFLLTFSTFLIFIQYLSQIRRIRRRKFPIKKRA